MPRMREMPMLAFWLFLFIALHPCVATPWPYRYLRKACINSDCSAVRVAISNPPINLWNANTVVELNTLLKSLNDQNSTKVVVISSDIPEFYITNLDANIFTPKFEGLDVTDILTMYFDNLALLSSIPTIFIAEINGRAWGAGNEHLLHMDMRFAGPEAQFSAPEVELGVIHVGGLQLLTKLIGPGRAAEYLLSGKQVDSKEAARVGWVNSAFSTAAALREHVDSLAKRIALFPIEAIRATKEGIAEQAPSRQSIQNDMNRYNKLAALSTVEGNIAKFLALSKNQSREWELNIGNNLVQLYT